MLSATVPAASAGSRALFTTIVSGGGTTTLTLADAAGTTVAAQKTYHDDSSFLSACVADLLTDNNIGSSLSFAASRGGYGCYVPYGNWYFNGPMPSDYGYTTPNQPFSGIHLEIAGRINLQVAPWFISTRAWDIEGVGNSGPLGQFQYFQTTYMGLGASVPAGFVLRSNADGVKVSGFAMTNVLGHGVWMGTTPGDQLGGGPAGVAVERMLITVHGSTGGGSPIAISNDTIGGWFRDLVLHSRHTGHYTVQFSAENFNGGSACCFWFDNISAVGRTIRVEAPGGIGGSGGGGGVGTIGGIHINKWIHESAPTAADVPGFFVLDGITSIPGASGSYGMGNITLNTVTFADAVSDDLDYAVFAAVGNGSTFSVSQVRATGIGGLGNLVKCAGNSTACNIAPPMVNSYFNDSAMVTNGTPRNGHQGAGLSISGEGVYSQAPLYLSIAQSQLGATKPAWAQTLPSPTSFAVSSVDTSGSLADNTYCFSVVGLDFQATPGMTLPARIVCQEITAGTNDGRIVLAWTEAAGGLAQAYSGFRVFFCAGASCTPNQYFSTSASPYNFTTISGGTGGTALPTVPAAFMSWIFWGRGGGGCILCTRVASSGNRYNFGIGIPATQSGSDEYKLVVGGGGLRVQRDAVLAASSYFTRAGFNLMNTTAATVGVQQYSPDGCWKGSGWKTNATAAAQLVEMCSQLVPVQGAAAPTAYLNWRYAVDGGAFGDLFKMYSTGRFEPLLYGTATNCADSAGAAACGAAPAGAFVVDAAGTTTVVSTTAVTANSRIQLTFDSSLGSELSITCNTTYVNSWVSARSAGASFTVTVETAPDTNPACFSYQVIN